MTSNELTSIVNSVREGQKGVNYSEEKYLEAQFTNDLMLVQMFIMGHLEKQKAEKTVTNGINVKSKTEFPSLVEFFLTQWHEEQKQKYVAVQKAAKTGKKYMEPENILDQLDAHQRA